MKLQTVLPALMAVLARTAIASAAGPPVGDPLDQCDHFCIDHLITECSFDPYKRVWFDESDDPKCRYCCPLDVMEYIQPSDPHGGH